jgi:hypothetical protein
MTCFSGYRQKEITNAIKRMHKGNNKRKLQSVKLLNTCIYYKIENKSSVTKKGTAGK